MLDVVHVIRKETSMPLCHNITGLGKTQDWPKGHKWVLLGDPDDGNATCPHCAGLRKALRQGR
jgi:hypothetical protein